MGGQVMMSRSDSLTYCVYELADELPKFRYPFHLNELPRDGVYLFFEDGETVMSRCGQFERITRVGTHRKDGRFRMRIRQHFGQVRSELGNKNGSVFRKHVGGALLRRADNNHPLLPNWDHGQRPGDKGHEINVSRWMRHRLSFACIYVPGHQERLDLESGLIALLAQHPIGEPTENWLGRFAGNPVIRCSGLWNTQRVTSQPLTETQFERLLELSQSYG
jgi:hypothetical protein